MNRSAIMTRLSDIIEFVSEEKTKHQTEWYPINLLKNLHSAIDDADEMTVLSKLEEIITLMVYQFFSYHDITFAIVVRFCSSIEARIALEHALADIIKMGDTGSMVEMKQLLREWIAIFPEDSVIPEEVEKQYSTEFVKLYNTAPRYWDIVFPEHVKRILPVTSGKELLSK
ncbi:MAG: hypothetical protein ACYDCO_21540 [Armatimonadota bacterium]